MEPPNSTGASGSTTPSASSGEAPREDPLRKLMLSMKRKAPNTLRLLRRDSMSSEGTMSEPDTPGDTDFLTEEDVLLYAAACNEEDSSKETPTSELLRRCRARREETSIQRRERLHYSCLIFEEKDLLLYKERCRMQNVKDVAYTVTTMLQKIDVKFGNAALNQDKMEEINTILAELTFIQLRYMEIQNIEAIFQCHSAYLISNSPVGSKEIPFINGFSAILELFIPYIRREALNAEASNKFFGGLYLNKTLNHESRHILPLMGVILENNDMAHPIFMLHMIKISVIVGCVEFIAGVFEHMRRFAPDREGYIQAMKELCGSVDSPDETEFSEVPLEILVMFNMHLLHLAARVASEKSVRCLLSFGADSLWLDRNNARAINVVGECTPEFDGFAFRFASSDEERLHCRKVLLQALPKDDWPTLEDVAIENGPNALELIETLLAVGANPLQPNAQKLFPFHFAQNQAIFSALTQPPVEPRALMLTLARSNAPEKDKIELLKISETNRIPLDMTFTDAENLNCMGVAAQRREYNFVQAIGASLQVQGTFQCVKVSKLEEELKLQKLININDALVSKEKLLKTETTLMKENNILRNTHQEEIMLRKNFEHDRELELETLKEQNRQLIKQVHEVMQLSDNAISVATSQKELQATLDNINASKNETNANVEKICKEKAEIEELVKRHRNIEASHQKQLNTKKFLIEKLKEERKKLQEENKSLKKESKEIESKLMSKVLELEDDNNKMSKDVKELKAKKIPQQQNSKEHLKALEQLEKLKREIDLKKAESERQKKSYEDGLNEMQSLIESLKSRIMNLESTLAQNRIEIREEREKQKQKMAAKAKEIALLKDELSALREHEKRVKETDVKESADYEATIKQLQLEKQELKKALEAKKQEFTTQELTFRVIQERLVYTTNEAESLKKQAQTRIRQLSAFCSNFLRESAEEFEIENDFEKSENTLEAETLVKDLESQIMTLKNVNAEVLKKYDQMISCCICEEKFESSGERTPVKLKCSHVFCGSCANSWLSAHGKKASCPQCRTIYRSGDIRPVNLNSEF